MSGKVARTPIPKPATLEHCHQVIEALAEQNELLRQWLVGQEEQLALLQERLKLRYVFTGDLQWKIHINVTKFMKM